MYSHPTRTLVWEFILSEGLLLSCEYGTCLHVWTWVSVCMCLHECVFCRGGQEHDALIRKKTVISKTPACSDVDASWLSLATHWLLQIGFSSFVQEEEKCCCDNGHIRTTAVSLNQVSCPLKDCSQPLDLDWLNYTPKKLFKVESASFRHFFWLLWEWSGASQGL